MRKGKTSKEHKDQLSIAIIPHSSGKVKVLNFTSLRTKALSVGLILVTAVVCMSIYTIHTFRENAVLRSNVEKLKDSSSDQNKLILEKAKEIEALRTNDEAVSKQIKEFAEQYRTITDRYITGRIDGAVTSRSGDRNEKNFVEDIKVLKGMLEDFKSLDSTETEAFSDLSDTEAKLKSYMDTIPTLWPAAGRLSDKYGYRRDPFTRRKTFHEGLDIGADYGASIKAAANGKVVFAGYKSGYGRMVIIDHGRGISTAYGHSSKLLVKEGQMVKKGDVIAKVGSSGRSTGPHVHFEVRYFDSPVDPLKYLD